ncbi:MAG: hypothetical protein OXP68_04225 [Anaerolineaceae bacterium]|nr:hypothetical protein [Anaerolineaceae bacterium]MDE0327858.1 hypothetical protein [Anaerolineaceae bacterium]
MSSTEKRKKAFKLLRDARNMRAHGLINDEEYKLIVSSILRSEIESYLEPRLREQNSYIQKVLDHADERLLSLSHAVGLP